MTLRVTHLSRWHDGALDALDFDGWFLRFTGDDESFDAMREELKTFSRAWARWMPAYHWRDDKLGAWWLDDAVLEELGDHFTNLDEALAAIGGSLAMQWIAKRQATRRKRNPASPVPAFLVNDYALLGIGARATLQEVKDAYRKRAKQLHPDAGGSHLAFIALQKAYERVSDFVKLHEMVAV